MPPTCSHATRPTARAGHRRPAFHPHTRLIAALPPPGALCPPQLTQETTRPLKQGSRALSAEISSLTTLQADTSVGPPPGPPGCPAHHTPFLGPLVIPCWGHPGQGPVRRPQMPPHQHWASLPAAPGTEFHLLCSCAPSGGAL